LTQEIPHALPEAVVSETGPHDSFLMKEHLAQYKFFQLGEGICRIIKHGIAGNMESNLHGNF
jgi:hypothetical protein